MRRLMMFAFASSMAIAASTGAASASDKVDVVASFSIIGDLARAVGGDRIRLATLVGPDGDAHVYQPKPGDAAAVANADVLLVNGLHFEGFLSRLIEASGTKAQVVEVSKGAELLPAADEGHGHDHGDKHEDAHSGHSGHDHDHDKAEAEAGHHQDGPHDPHAWQSVRNAIVYVGNIADAFCNADAEGCDTYKANAAEYTAQLETLDADVRKRLGAIPAEKRVVITSHDAFGYLAHAYGLTFLAPEGVSTEAEASAADVAALIRQVRDDKASAIFVENITDRRLVDRIAAETGLKVGGRLYSDALSGPGGPAATYVDMMRHNVDVIAGAIGGS